MPTIPAECMCLQGAIVTFTKGVATELAGKKIRCNVIAPGPVWTPLIPASFPPDIVSLLLDLYFILLPSVLPASSSDLCTNVHA